MPILSDKTIKKLVEEQKMIEPFHPQQIKHNKSVGILSYGVSSYGYDVRCSSEMYLFEGNKDTMLDPKKFDTSSSCISYTGSTCIMKPYSFLLTRTIERFIIPENVLAVCVGKSTYARCGIVLNTTPLEPGWEGYITLELANVTPYHVKIYAEEGICQVLFFQGDQDCSTSYRSRKGKYQNQEGITVAKV